MCLTCSGVHRGLGVHISFVRSITMDAFKPAELERMAKGGNKPWKDFFDAHEQNNLEGRTFEDSTINERYDCEAGEEWKEMLTAKVEGKDYVPQAKGARAPKKRMDEGPRRMEGIGSGHTSRSGTPAGVGRVQAAGGRSGSPSLGTASTGKKAQNEAYFAKMGAENASRPDGVAPNQGGKFGGFGSEPMPARGGAGAPGLDDLQKDPVAALTKGFGWLSTTVTKSAAQGYEGWVKPGMQKVCIFTFRIDPRLTLCESCKKQTSPQKLANAPSS